jgi:small subunit ribosomal protein S1
VAEEVEGILSFRHRRDKVEDARNQFKVGDSVEAKIISVDGRSRSGIVDQGEGGP